MRERFYRTIGVLLLVTIDNGEGLLHCFFSLAILSQQQSLKTITEYSVKKNELTNMTSLYSPFIASSFKCDLFN